jgi:hypothetical protein
MGLFLRPDSPFWWAFLEGTRKKVNTRVPHQALTAEGRKALKIQAEAIYHQHMVAIARRGVGLPVESAMTFSAYADWYDTHHIATHKSAYSERGTLKHLRAFFGAELLRDIRPARVAEYRAQRVAAGVKPGSVHREIKVLKTMLNRAVGEHFDASPLAAYRQRRVKLKPKRTITGTEEPALLKALLEIDPEIHDMYVVGVGTLLRQENVATLRRSALRGRTLVVDTKTGPHTLDLTGPTELQTRAWRILKKRAPIAQDGLFFPTWGAVFSQPHTKSGPKGRASFLRRVRRACKAAGLPWGLDTGGLVWHSATRATGATRLIREYQIDVRTVQLMGPWSSLDQMAEYLGLPAAPGTKREQ